MLTYLIAGPPAGFFGLLSYMYVADLARGVEPNLMGSASGAPLAFLLSYIFGALPAMVTGLVMAALASRGLDRPWRRIAASVPVGALASILCLFWIILGPNGGESKWSVVAMIAITGGVAALVSSSILEFITRRPSA